MDRADPNWGQWSPWEGVHHKGRRILKEDVIVNAKFQALGMWGWMLVLATMCSRWCWKPFQLSTLVLWMWFRGMGCVKLCEEVLHTHVRERIWRVVVLRYLGHYHLLWDPGNWRGIIPRSKGFSFSFTRLLGTSVVDCTGLVEIVIFLETHVYGVVPTWVGYPQHSLLYH